MNQPRIRISAGAALLAAIVYYVCDTAKLMAVFIPVIVHELGHVIVLEMLGLKIRGLKVQLKGFCIEYLGCTGAVGHALSALGGPAAGLLYAWASSFIGNHIDSQWFNLSSGASIILSLFNLMPTLPLDGGMVMLHLSCAFLGEKRGERLTYMFSTAFGALLLSAGIWLMINGKGVALTIAALWVLLYMDQCMGIVKRREVL